MYRANFILLAACLLVFGTVNTLFAQSQARATVEGKLTDLESGQPLQGAHIFLSGTTLGTYTNRSGNYALRRIPYGSFRMIISMIGYERMDTTLTIEQGERLNLDLSLKPVVYEMEELSVDHLGKKWRKNLARFEELFLGVTENADSVRIRNPEVLRFDSNFWGRLTAEARAPLQIVNRSLGYEITYYLYEFRHSGNTTYWHGEPLFKEMTPSDYLEEVLWEFNRVKAFYGSMRHFWLAVLEDRVEEEGFRIYKVWNHQFPGQRESRFKISPDDLVRQGEKEYLKEVRFSGSLEIVYVHEEEGLRYLDWIKEYNRGPGGPQVSWLELIDRSITVDRTGEVIEPFGVLQQGYLGFQRLADLTPREYRPDQFFKGNER